jgi:hypothetical protein
MRRVLTSMTLSLCLAGCGDSDELDLVAGPTGPRPIAGCNFDYSQCDVREKSCQLEKLSIAACVRGDEPGELPLVSVMTEAEFDAYLATASPRPDPDYWEQAYVMLGLVAPGALSAKRKPRRTSNDFAAFYRWHEKDIVFIDHGEPFDDLNANTTLVHEFVHALQDREVDLEAFALAHYENDDVYIAADSVTEGEAWMLEDRVRAAMLGLDLGAVDWESRLNELVEYGEDWLFEQPSPFLAVDEMIPYVHGARYLYPGFRDDGHAAVLAAFANPPASSKALMLGYPEDAEFTPFSELAPPAGVEHFATSNLGAIGLYLLLDSDSSDRDRARELALTWRNDKLAIYFESEAESPIVILSVEASEDTLARLEARLSAVLTHMESRQSGERIRIAASKSGSADLSWALEAEL